MVFSGYMPRRGVAGSCGSFIPSFLRGLHTVLHNGGTNLHSHPQCKTAPFSAHPLQHVSSVDFAMLSTSPREPYLELPVLRARPLPRHGKWGPVSESSDGLQCLCQAPPRLFPQANTDVCSVTIDSFALFTTLYKWNHAICTFWLLSVNIIILRSIYIIVFINSSFIFVTEVQLIALFSSINKFLVSYLRHIWLRSKITTIFSSFLLETGSLDLTFRSCPQVFH